MELCPVVVVDDHVLTRRALGELVDATPGLRLAASLGSGEDAIAYVATADGPVLVVLDVRLPGIGGIEVAQSLAGVEPAHVILLTSADDDVGATVTALGLPFVPKSRLTGRELLEAWRRRSAS